MVNRTFDTQGNVLTQTEQFNRATTRYQYNQYSLVTQMTKPRGNTTSIERDNKGNPIKITNAASHITTLQYNTQGLVTRMVSPNDLVTTYTYNPQGLMLTKTETPPSGSPGNVRIWRYRYDAAGQLTQAQTPDGITISNRYDNKGRLTEVQDNLNQSLRYTYDAYDNLIATETVNHDGNLALRMRQLYDNRNRPIQTQMPHISEEQSTTIKRLDNNSNLIGMTDPNNSLSSHSYDREDRLISNTHRENGITSTMTYDNLERVITKTYPNTIAGKTENVTYTYDDVQGNSSAAGTRLQDAGGRAVSGTNSRGSTTTESITYLYTDHLMTNRLATDSTQAVVWRWEGEAFGNTPAEELAGVQVNLRFPGQYYDAETNLHYNRYRYYDPQLGRCIITDPMGLVGSGFNTYVYVNQNQGIISATFS